VELEQDKGRRQALADRPPHGATDDAERQGGLEETARRDPRDDLAQSWVDAKVARSSVVPNVTLFVARLGPLA
jgi:hypothetical protein